MRALKLLLAALLSAHAASAQGAPRDPMRAFLANPTYSRPSLSASGEHLRLAARFACALTSLADGSLRASLAR